MNKFLFIPLCIVLCNSCCTEKACTGPELPVVVLQLKGLPAEADSRVVLYTLQNGAVVDSSVSSLQPGAPRLFCRPFDSYAANPARSFTLKWNGKEQSVTGLSCDFREEKIKCNVCFPFGNGSEKIQTYSNFGFQSGGSTYHQNDTLFINW